MLALRRVLPEMEYHSNNLLPECLDKIEVKMDDFLGALKEVEPSATRELMVEVPRICWQDVGGLGEVKSQLQEAVEWPFKYELLYKSVGIDLPRGILLYGPPGTGKTMLARAMANEINANFISIKGSALLSKWVGESEKALREVFKKARQVAPCIIFFDEIDALVPHRGMGGQVTERMLSQLLTEMDGLEELQRVVVLAATNRLDMIDSALLRPGRFDLIIPMELPGEGDRSDILTVHLRSLPLAGDVDELTLVAQTAGFSGADLANFVRRAALLAIREHVQQIGEWRPGEEQVTIRARHFSLALRELTQQRVLVHGKGDSDGDT
jgi:transitional endoplasmic reticulum ATPase